MKVNRELQQALDAAGAVLIREAKHRVYRVPGAPQLLVIGCTPSDYRANQNNISRLRRMLRQKGQQ